MNKLMSKTIYFVNHAELKYIPKIIKRHDVNIAKNLLTLCSKDQIYNLKKYFEKKNIDYICTSPSIDCIKTMFYSIDAKTIKNTPVSIFSDLFDFKKYEFVINDELYSTNHLLSHYENVEYNINYEHDILLQNILKINANRWLNDFTTRIKDKEYKNILVIGHKDFFRLFFKQCLDIKNDDYINMNNGTIRKINFVNNKFSF